jgi:hypothetical protein
VDPHDVVPLGEGHVRERPVAQDAGVVDEDVEPAELLDRRGDQSLGPRLVGDVVAVHHGLPAERPDVVDDLLRGPDRGPGAVNFGAEVVDDHIGPLAGELERMLTPDAPAGAGDHDDTTLAKSRHALLLPAVARNSR